MSSIIYGRKLFWDFNIAVEQSNEEKMELSCSNEYRGVDLRFRKSTLYTLNIIYFWIKNSLVWLMFAIKNNYL